MKEVVSYNQINALKLRFLFRCSCILLAFFCSNVNAQTSEIQKTYQGLILDEVMVKAVQSGFDVNAFVQRVKNDTTFYKAFKTLRILSFDMYNDINIQTKKGDQKASYNSITHQNVSKRCRSMTVTREKVSGDFYTRKHNYNYRTADLYAHLFFTVGTLCNQNNIVGKAKEYKGTKKYEEQLRMLIFNPGQRIYGIPGIGDNVAIFEEPTFSKYEFRLSRALLNGEDCYSFKAIPKKDYAKEVVINELKTWFRVSDFAIVARDYSLSYKTLFYDFDVNMKVKLKTVFGMLVPYEIAYKGNWHVFSKDREIANFTAIFTEFKQ